MPRYNVVEENGKKKLVLAEDILVSEGGSVDSSKVVMLTGDQTIDGVKTFNEPPVVPQPLTADELAALIAGTGTENNPKVVPVQLLVEILKKYLALSGGTLSGALGITNKLGSGNIFFYDPDMGGKQAVVSIFASKNDTERSLIIGMPPLADDAIQYWSSIIIHRMLSNVAGGAYVQIPILEENLPNIAAITKGFADNNYVKKSGDTITGELAIRINALSNEVVDTDTYSNINFVGTDNKRIGVIRCNTGPSSGGIHYLGFYAVDYNNRLTQAMSIATGQDGKAFSTCPPPRAAYNSDIVNNTRLIDFAQEKLTGITNIHLGGTGASDTADIHNGRGRSADKPFASFDAALNYINTHLNGCKSVYLILHDNFTVTGLKYCNVNFVSLLITSDDTIRTLTINNELQFQKGNIVFKNIKLQASSNTNYFVTSNGVYGNVNIMFDSGVEMSGTVKTASVRAMNNGTIHIYVSPTGNVTGSRYSLVNGGKILTAGKGANAIPGSSDGTSGTGNGLVYA